MKRRRTLFALRQLAHDVGLVDAQDLCDQVKERTRRKDLDHLALPGKRALHNPHHRDQEQSHNNSLKEDVHLYVKTDFSPRSPLVLVTMKNVHNAVSDVLDILHVTHRYRDQVQTFDDQPHRTVVRLYTKDTDELRLEFEVLEDSDDDHVICILRRVGLTRRAAERIVDTLLEVL